MSELNEQLIARVLMPEKGLFSARSGFQVESGRRVLVSLDYGEDVGEVADCAPYDPEIHGPRIPGFNLMRAVTQEDNDTFADNARLAEAMSASFTKDVLPDIPDFRLCHVRLSFGRTRLFLRFTSEKQRPDLSKAIASISRRYGISVNVWQLGPRDEVAAIGALGPCGRVCCCCSWQKRYPSGLTAELAKSASSSNINGSCGRFRCCLAFEEQMKETPQ